MIPKLERFSQRIFLLFATLLLLLVGGLAYREISFLLARNQAYKDLKAATEKQDYTEVVKAAQTFLDYPPLIGRDRDEEQVKELSTKAHQEILKAHQKNLFHRAVEAAEKQNYFIVVKLAKELLIETPFGQQDPRYHKVKRLYAQALLQWSAQQEEDSLNPSFSTHLQTYKSLP